MILGFIQERIQNWSTTSHYKDHFYIFTNADGAKNYKVMKTPVDKTSKEHWEEVLPHREADFIGGSRTF